MQHKITLLIVFVKATEIPGYPNVDCFLDVPYLLPVEADKNK